MNIEILWKIFSKESGGWGNRKRE